MFKVRESVKTFPRMWFVEDVNLLSLPDFRHVRGTGEPLGHFLLL